MFTGDHAVIAISVLFGLILYPACLMERWSPPVFWTFQGIWFIAAIAIPSVHSALFPDATEATRHLMFLALSTAGNVVVGARIITWIEKREQRRSKP